MNAALIASPILWCLLGTNANSDESLDLRFLKPIDVAGVVHRLVENEDRLGTCFVFFTPDAPESRAALQATNQLAESIPTTKIAFFGVVSSSKLHRSDASDFAEKHDPSFPILFDATGELHDLLQPTQTHKSVLLDRSGRIVYRGEGDERWQQATTALAEGKPIAHPITSESDDAPASKENQPDEVTFARHIAPLLFANCTECHRPGQVGPFPLLTYEDASKRAEFLAEVTRSRLMPPWRAEIDFGHFSDERRLTDRQVELIQSWAAAGAPMGDERDLPPVPSYPDGWRLGTPDVVVEAPVPFEVPADGPDIFQHFVMPVELPEDKTLVGFEFRPSNPAVAHHAVVFLDASGRARELDAKTPEPGYQTSGSVGGGMTALIGVWTPGMTPRRFPQGIGIRMPRTVDVVLQLHLHPSGKPETEQSKIALYFSDKPTEEVRRQETLLLGSLAIDIPPGQDRHEIRSTMRLPIDVTLLSVFPHLHLIGKEMKVVATLPSGDTVPLIWIQDWNFYWQDSYLYKEPVKLPRGTRIDILAAYNNTAENPFNPSQPPKRVLFGNGSTDEMCFAIFQMVSEERQSMMRLAPALMQSFLTEWRKADIDHEAREKIVDEAAKLFGERSTKMLRTLLLKPDEST